ncbi:MAG: hypothetical protein WA833_05245, partial [Nitrosotalea sp.]
MIKKNSILLLGTISVLVIISSSISTTNVFAQGYSTPHSVAKLSNCFQAPSPNVNWSNCTMFQNQYHFSNLSGANLSGT